MTPETKTEARERMSDENKPLIPDAPTYRELTPEEIRETQRRVIKEHFTPIRDDSEQLRAALSALRAEHQRVQAGAIEDAATVRRMEAALLLAQKLADPAHEETCTSPDCVACNTQDAIGGALAEPGPRSWGRGVLDRAEREIASLRSQLAEAQAALDACRKANDEGRAALAASEEKARGMASEERARCERVAREIAAKHVTADGSSLRERHGALEVADALAALSSSPAPGAAPKCDCQGEAPEGRHLLSCPVGAELLRKWAGATGAAPKEPGELLRPGMKKFTEGCRKFEEQQRKWAEQRKADGEPASPAPRVGAESEAKTHAHGCLMNADHESDCLTPSDLLPEQRAMTPAERDGHRRVMKRLFKPVPSAPLIPQSRAEEMVRDAIAMEHERLCVRCQEGGCEFCDRCPTRARKTEASRG